MAKCFVSYLDTSGIRHEVEAEAQSMYEAAALAVRTFKDHDCEPGNHGLVRYGQRAFLAVNGHTFARSSSDCPVSCPLIRAKVFPRSVWVADVYLNCEERQDVCPLGGVFCIGRVSESCSL